VAGLGALCIMPFSPLAGRTLVGVRGVLDRVLVRSLPGNAQITVTRSWLIAFEDGGAGRVFVSGQQIGAKVDAPAALQALAKLEAARDESDLFPLDLDPAGQIMGDAHEATPAPLPGEVAASALAFARARDTTANPDEASRRFLADLSQHAEKWITGLPADLFYPDPRNREVTREVVLPDGTTGTITMREIVKTADATGLLKSYRREASATAGNAAKTGSETWTLFPAVS
tara:strand:- start:1244 stop:1933 length:690 start_codon:yes stop_codon:yes gene_type:complete